MKHLKSHYPSANVLILKKIKSTKKYNNFDFGQLD